MIHSPLFLRLGQRMRGPRDAPPGVLRRVVFSNIVSSDAVAQYPSIIAGTSDLLIEDVKLSNIYLQQIGGTNTAWQDAKPPENPAGYPEADMFGPLPATGFFLRHARNIQMTDIEIATVHADNRPAIWADSVDGLDIFRLRSPVTKPVFALKNIRTFRVFGSQSIPDRQINQADREVF